MRIRIVTGLNRAIWLESGLKLMLPEPENRLWSSPKFQSYEQNVSASFLYHFTIARSCTLWHDRSLFALLELLFMTSAELTGLRFRTTVLHIAWPCVSGILLHGLMHWSFITGTWLNIRSARGARYGTTVRHRDYLERWVAPSFTVGMACICRRCTVVPQTARPFHLPRSEF